MSIGVIFDMDGVLVDTYRAHFESWRIVAEAEGIPFPEHHFARTFGRTSREIIAMTWPESPAEDRVREIDDRKEALFREIIENDFPMMEGARDVVQALRAAGFRTAVGSSAPPENVELALGQLGRHLFDAVVNGRDVQRGKPDPQVFLLAAAKLGIEPARCLVVEDAEPGIEAARRGGMAAVAMLSTGRSEEDFRAARPDLTVRSLRDLTPEVVQGLVGDRVPEARGKEAG
jgi:beta-phosphoglucomutase